MEALEWVGIETIVPDSAKCSERTLDKMDEMAARMLYTKGVGAVTVIDKVHEGNATTFTYKGDTTPGGLYLVEQLRKKDELIKRLMESNFPTVAP